MNKICVYCKKIIKEAHKLQKYHKPCLKEKERIRIRIWGRNNCRKPEVKEHRRKYNLKHREKRKKYNKVWRKRNKEHTKTYKKEYDKENSEHNKKYKKEWYKRNKDYNKSYYQKNKVNARKEGKERYEKNKDTPEFKKYQKEYNKKNRKKILQKSREYQKNNREKTNKRLKNRRLIDKNYNTLIRISSRFNKALRLYTKTGKIMPSGKYGINYKKIIEYLEPFPKDYLTSNGKYHIHHIKPLFTFNFVHKDGSTNLKEVRRAWTPKNLIILTKEEHKEIHRKLR